MYAFNYYPIYFNFNYVKMQANINKSIVANNKHLSDEQKKDCIEYIDDSVDAILSNNYMKYFNANRKFRLSCVENVMKNINVYPNIKNILYNFIDEPKNVNNIKGN